MKLTRTLCAAALLLPLSIPALAANGEWTTVATACMPDEAAIASYSNDAAATTIATGITGDIVLRCNITDPADWFNVADPLWNTMDVTYNDPDGAGIDKAVLVSLRRVHESTGVSSTITTFSSNGFPAGQQLRSAPITHAFDFYNYAYYLQVTLRRASLDADGDGVADPSPRLQRVRLWVYVPG